VLGTTLLVEAAIAEWIDRLPSDKEGKTSKCFVERRLRFLSPEISFSVVPNGVSLQAIQVATVAFLCDGSRPDK
jgi:hypothetical protein